MVLLVRASTRGGVSLTNAAIPILSNYCKHGVEETERGKESGRQHRTYEWSSSDSSVESAGVCGEGGRIRRAVNTDMLVL